MNSGPRPDARIWKTPSSHSRVSKWRKHCELPEVFVDGVAQGIDGRGARPAFYLVVADRRADDAADFWDGLYSERRPSARGRGFEAAGSGYRIRAGSGRLAEAA